MIADGGEIWEKNENYLEIEAILDGGKEPREFRLQNSKKSWKTLTKCAYVFEMNLLKLTLRLEDKYLNPMETLNRCWYALK